MKDFDPIKHNPDQVKIVNEAKVAYEKKFIGTTRRYNGHKFFEINCATGEIKEAEFEDEKVVIVPNVNLITGEVNGSTNVVKRDISCNENCLYIAALNLKSARKKYFDYILRSIQHNIRNLPKEK
jgi:hypothetical protein